MSTLELKGNLLTLMVLHLQETNIESITEQLAEKISKAPMFFQHAPIVIDLHAVQNDDNSVDVHDVVKVVRTAGLMPIAIRGGNPQQREIALSLNLGLLTHTTPTPHSLIEELEQKEEKEEEQSIIPMSSMCKIVTHPIRSGQRVVALNSDLIVLGTVSHGAEVLAHRHIHIYGPLRGRAFAGINGDKEARIFCQQFNAELLSIAGKYRVNEEFPENLLSQSVQVYLKGNDLEIEPL
ncbi:MAG: septum site-determining protein MinC [Thiomargarita sp.]|nr:septum site-determining protein MinC [Thiomargarita sp.]